MNHYANMERGVTVPTKEILIRVFLLFDIVAMTEDVDGPDCQLILKMLEIWTAKNEPCWNEIQSGKKDITLDTFFRIKNLFNEALVNVLLRPFMSKENDIARLVK